MPFDPVLAAAQTSNSPQELTVLSQHRFIGIRLEVARNPSTPADVLYTMSHDASPRVRGAVAENPSLADELVVFLAEDHDALVRRNAAENVIGRPEVIARLSNSEHPAVRARVAGRSQPSELPLEVQITLTRDSHRAVREQVAEKTLFREVFDVLLDDSDPRVRGHCAANPRATREDFDRLLANPSAKTRQLAVDLGVIYPDSEQLMSLAWDRSADVQWAVIMRVGTPRAATEIIAENGDEMNRQQARFVLGGGGHSSQAITSVLKSRADALEVAAFV